MASVASARSHVVSPASRPAAEIDYASHGYSYPSVPVLYEMALDRREVRLAATGPMLVETGVHTGRSAKTSSWSMTRPLTIRSGGVRSISR